MLSNVYNQMNANEKFILKQRFLEIPCKITRFGLNFTLRKFNYLVQKLLVQIRYRF